MKIKKRKLIKKLFKYDLNNFKNHDTITLSCSNCKVDVHGCTATAVAVLCHRCTTNLVPIEEKIKKEPSGFPRGWKLYSRFVHANGKVYDKGIEQTELEGTLPPTDMEEIKRKSKEKRLSKKEKIKKNEAKMNKIIEKRKKAKKIASENKKKKMKELLDENR